MTHKIKLCKTEEVTEGAPLCVNPDGLPSLAVYQLEEEYFVTDNLCSHGNALLTDGYQEGAEIECAFHGGSFCIKTGEPKAFPCQVAIKTYPVTIDNDEVFIDVQ